MKTIALVLVLVAVASAQFTQRQPGGNRGSNVGGASGATGGAIPPVNGGVPGFGPGLRSWGPRVYGPGVKNRWALSPNPFIMQRALGLLNHFPEHLLFVDVNGEVRVTDKFGRDPEPWTTGGIDVEELLEF